VREALLRLNEHVADQAKLDADRRAAGQQLRAVTIVFIAITAVSLGLFMLMPERGVAYPILLLALLVSGLIGLIGFIVDLSIVPRETPATAEKAAKSFFKAMGIGRHGYAWACLCPTAREQVVEPPSLDPVLTGEGQFKLETPEDMKAFTSTFARAGQGQVRSVQVKSTSLVEEKGDVAVVECQLFFQAWPRWVTMLMGFAVACGGIGAVIVIVLMQTMRKTRMISCRKTLLRGKNNLWYMYTADPLEGVEEPD
jgi:hypothetical protein